MSLNLSREFTKLSPRIIGQKLFITYFSTEGGNFSNLPVIIPTLKLSCKKIGLVITGILTGKQTTMPSSFLNTGLFLPLKLIKKLGLNKIVALTGMLRGSNIANTYSMIQLKLKKGADPEKIEKQISSMGLRSISLGKFLKEINRFFIILNAILFAIGGVALIVAGLGIANTMIISVLENRREIGILKAVGASKNDVRKEFLFESSFLGLIGGSLGVAMGWLVSIGVNFAINAYIKSQGMKGEFLFRFPFWLILLAICFAEGISLISALYPAQKAAKLDPIDALRFQ